TVTSARSYSGSRRPIDDDIVRDDIARCFRLVLASPSGRLALTSYPSISQALLTGLHHQDEFVRQIAAEQLLGLYVQDGIRDRLRAVLAADDVFGGVVESLADPSTSVAENIANLLVEIGDTKRFFGDTLRSRIKSVAESDATVLIRVLTLAARMGNLSEQGFREFQESGVLADAMARLMDGGDDPLLQMSLFAVV
ncbi:hypothetical protein BVRB_039370, partial [Beta vulgaris subsp. vulgaris]